MKNLENPITYLTNKDPENQPLSRSLLCGIKRASQATAEAILSKGNAHIFRAGI